MAKTNPGRFFEDYRVGDVLTHAVGAVPRHFFDTQIAGGFVGYGTPSLSALLNGEL